MPPADSLAAAADLVLSRAYWLGVAGTLVRVGLILALAVGVLMALGSVQRRWVARVLGSDAASAGRRQRVQTVAGLLGSVARYVVWAVAGVMLLSEVGVAIGPLLASAGIAGLAIGFGAQTLVKDVISGFFLLFDDTIGHGDLVTFQGQTGTVEYVGLRLIKVRTFDGELLMIPAGEMRVFGNKSVGFARAVVPVGLSYEQDVQRALDALQAVADEWAATPEARAVLLGDPPTVQALTELGESAVTARIVVPVRPGEQFAAERDLRRRVKERFDALGIEIPFPRRTVYVKRADDEGGLDDDALAAAAGA